MKNLTILFLSLSIFFNLYSQDTTKIKLALLPIISEGIDLVSVNTAESILRMELAKENKVSLINERTMLSVLNNEVCNDEECAKDIGEKLDASQVVLCKMSPLGEKIIIQYQVIEVSTGKTVLSDRATSTSIEDLDAVMKRVAISVANQNSFNANKEVGNIVKQESVIPISQAARYNFGVGFGYLFPSAGYDNSRKKSFTLNGYFDYEIKDFAAGLMLGARKGFAINLYGNYLFSKTDISPYLGTSLGFHWVAHEDWLFGDDNKDGDGIELGLQGGIRIFHTYNFQMFIQGEYIMTFNDYNDRAFVFTIGIL